MASETMPTGEINDAGLVAASLNGQRDAFRQIVERYQTLIASVAYCATGSLSQSEDLAQETFVTAWQKLPALREPEKLRSWLCGITRFLISRQFRSQGREPVHAAESLAVVEEWTAPEPSPSDQVIGDEEKAILWRSLERLPEIYREPLVLFYRQQQSITAVAQDLGLSEEAVKQRLSRGRKLLQEQFLDFVAGALKQTTPGRTFTLGVLASLPLLTTTAKAATATATATKGGAMAKATGLGALFQAVLKTMASCLGILSPFLLLGGFFGFKMGGDARQSPAQRESVVTFWRILVGCLAAFVVLPVLLLIMAGLAHVSDDFRQKLLQGLTDWLGLMYFVVPAALVLWAWQRRSKPRTPDTGQPDGLTVSKPKRLGRWVVVTMIVAAGLLGLLFLDSGHGKVQRMTTQEVQEMILSGRGKEADFSVLQYQNGSGNLWIELRQPGQKTKITAPVDDATLAMIKAQGFKCPTYVQGRDFEVFGWPGRLLPVFCVFILAIGAVVLLRRPAKYNPQTMDAGQIQQIQRAEKEASRVCAAVAALAMIGLGVLCLLFASAHGAKSLTRAGAASFLASHPHARVEVFQFADGTMEEWITPPGSRTYPGFKAPADALTVSRLTANNIPFNLLVQGRDFGFRGPGYWLSPTCGLVLMVGAGLMIWHLARRWKPLSAA